MTRTRSGIYTYLSDVLDRKQYAVWSEMSFPAPGYADGPKPDNFVSRGAWMVDGKFGRRPTAGDVVLVIEVSSRSRPKDTTRAALYAQLAIAEYWLVDLRGAAIVQHSQPVDGNYRVVETLDRRMLLTSKTIAQLTVGTDFLLQLGTYLIEPAACGLANASVTRTPAQAASKRDST